MMLPSKPAWLRGTLAAALSACVVLAAPPKEAEAESAKTFTVSVIYGADKPQAKLWFKMKELIERELPGQFNFKIVTDGALGGEKETTEGIRLGSIHGAESTLANLTTWVPEGALFDMPFIFRDQAHIDKVMAGPIGAEFDALYAAQGFKVLGYITYGARHVISKEPIRAPADVEGKKMRVLQSQLHIDLWESLGASPTAVPITEAYTALETGVVDYMDMTKSGYHALKLFEVVPSFTETSHIWALGALYMGKSYWDGLTPEQQAAFQEATDEAIPYFNKLAAAEQAASLQQAVSAGATVIEPDREAWREAMVPFWKAYAPNVGGLDKVMEIVNTK